VSAVIYHLRTANMLFLTLKKCLIFFTIFFSFLHARLHFVFLWRLFKLVGRVFARLLRITRAKRTGKEFTNRDLFYACYSTLPIDCFFSASNTTWFPFSFAFTVLVWMVPFWFIFLRIVRKLLYCQKKETNTMLRLITFLFTTIQHVYF